MARLTNQPQPVTDRRSLTEVIDTLTDIASDRDLVAVLQQGVALHKERLMAYLLGTDARRLDPHDILEMFERAYLLTAPTLTEAYTALLEHHGWQDTLDQLGVANGEDPIGIFLRWDTDAIRDRFKESYDFVQTSSGWCVFDADVLRERLDP